MNAQSLRNKLGELHVMLHSGIYDVIAVTETWFKSCDVDSMIVENTGYTIVRDDRRTKNADGGTRAGGGVCLIIRSSIKFNTVVVPVAAYGNNIDYICIDLHGFENNYRLMVCYIPPFSCGMNVENLNRFLDSIAALFTCDSSVVWFGDFNFPDIVFSEIDNMPTSCRGEYSTVFTDFVLECALQQFVHSPTRGDKLIDLVFSNDAFSICDLKVSSPFSTSDHNSISCLLYCGETSRQQRSAAAGYSFKRADWEGIGVELASINWNDILDNRSCEELWAAFYETITNVVDNHVPRCTNKRGVSSRKQYPKIIRRLQSRKLIIWRKWQTDRNNRLPKTRYSEVTRQCRQAIYEYNVKTEESLVDANNIGKFYDHVNKKLATKSSIGVLKNDQGSYVTDPTEQAEMLNSYFATTFVDDNGALPEFPSRVDDDTFIAYIAFNSQDISKKLNKLRENSAYGPDSLPPSFLKRTSKFISRPLSFLFESSFLNAYIPPIWKEANVKPIHKKGNANCASNYRPISLTCSIAKVMESIVHEQLMAYLVANNLISKHQHGFLAGRSTCTNLLDSLQDWILALKDHLSIDVAYIDFSKAFDSVVHPKLLHKLAGYGIQHELLLWIKSFLENRTQRVVIDGHFSNTVPVRSGVVQGSVLGPLLFIIFVGDVTDLLGTTLGTKLYADDLKLYTRVKLDEPGSLADGLTRLEEWSVKWQLGINESKCSVMHIGNGAWNIPYSINKILLPSVDKVCDLGVTYDNKLSFGDHIGNVVSRAYQRIYLIFRSFVSKNVELLKRAYITYVRPLLEYCTPVWSPHLIKNIGKIENVQRYFTRRLLPKNNDGYTDRLMLLGLETLELRRLKFDLKMY